MQLLRLAVGTRPRSQRSHSYQGDRKLWCLEDFGSFRVISLVRFTKFHQVSFIKSLTFSYRLARERPDCQRPLCSDPPDKVHKLPIASTSWSIVPPQYSEMLSEWNRDSGQSWHPRHIAPKQPQHCAPSDSQVDTRPPHKSHRRKGPQMQGYWKKHSIQRKNPTISVLPEARDSKENLVTMSRHWAIA